MLVETLKDVLHWTREFHQYLSGCMHRCASRNESERAALLLDYLADHERLLARILEQFEENAEPHAQDSWFSEFFSKEPAVRFPCDKPFAKMNSQEIMAETIAMHEQVISLYRDLRSRFQSPSSYEVLDELISLEEHEAMRMVQSANRLEDL